MIHPANFSQFVEFYSLKFFFKFLFLRVKAKCFARLCHRLGVHICPSVTLVICIKTVQARITKSLLWAAPKSLVYRDKISIVPLGARVPLERGRQRGVPTKKTSF